MHTRRTGMRGTALVPGAKTCDRMRVGAGLGVAMIEVATTTAVALVVSMVVRVAVSVTVGGLGLALIPVGGQASMVAHVVDSWTAAPQVKVDFSTVGPKGPLSKTLAAQLALDTMLGGPVACPTMPHKDLTHVDLSPRARVGGSTICAVGMGQPMGRHVVDKGREEALTTGVLEADTMALDT
uniref:Uncharacterized protein n=1 Tax=Pyramimonas obovata TaxID=1411642 RepID=A0A7S0MRF2_9CHLO|mmetsp:Transcript_10847/g.22630  ORF Transcript_10847/g.22630 Transcript_10847/m.22630 type:complete len:182 (+) Transcript_10847:515-1060(+)